MTVAQIEYHLVENPLYPGVLTLLVADQANLPLAGKGDQVRGATVRALQVREAMLGLAALHELPHGVFGPFTVIIILLSVFFVPNIAEIIEIIAENAMVVRFTRLSRQVPVFFLGFHGALWMEQIACLVS